MSLNITLAASSPLDKYPAKQHARNVARNASLTFGMIFLGGQPTIEIQDTDGEVPFRQRRNFYYLTGVDDIPGCEVTYLIEKDQLLLWLPVPDPDEEIWSGKGVDREEAMYRYDVDYVFYIDQMINYLTYYIVGTPERMFYYIHDHLPSFISKPNCLESPLPRDNTTILPFLFYTRTIKDAHEISLIRHANKISTHAHTALLHSFSSPRPPKNERHLHALFVQQSIAHGATEQAYEPICGSGKNCAILHYVHNNQSLADRQLALIDAGAEWRCYASDVTRTFPISGTFTPKALAVYNAVLKTQMECIAFIRPGVYFTTIAAHARKTILEALMDMRIVKAQGGLEELVKVGLDRLFMPHGLGHHLGLDVHDNAPYGTIPALSTATKPTSTSLSQKMPSADLFEAVFERHPLEVGNVITVEPGIYFNKTLIERMIKERPDLGSYVDMAVLEGYWDVGGVRIEDDILVTETGWENLTSAPKVATELERMVAGRGASPGCKCGLTECEFV